jgi:hypothetical protein
MLPLTIEDPFMTAIEAIGTTINDGIPDVGAEFLVELRKAAEFELRSYDAPSQKHRRHDSRRNEYLNQLCRFWVALGGLPTTSFDHRKGKAGEGAGDFVDFIQLAAGPVLARAQAQSGITANGARRAIENWRKKEPSGVRERVVFRSDARIPGSATRYIEPPHQPPGYARLKNRRPRKQS